MSQILSNTGVPSAPRQLCSHSATKGLTDDNGLGDEVCSDCRAVAEGEGICEVSLTKARLAYACVTDDAELDRARRWGGGAGGRGGEDGGRSGVHRGGLGRC